MAYVVPTESCSLAHIKVYYSDTADRIKQAIANYRKNDNLKWGAHVRTIKSFFIIVTPTEELVEKELVKLGAKCVGEYPRTHDDNNFKLYTYISRPEDETKT